ncbi:murein hydrolase activator EnvC family protein [Glutamicibacter arilaitensis]|nr:M23 family metallopeptidase [Glutamicibacter arilaitensis]
MNLKFTIATLQVLLLGLGLPGATALERTHARVEMRTALTTADGWQWPLAGVPEIQEPFDRPAEKWLSGHRGIDLAASAGDTVHAPQRGWVSFASVIVDRPVLVIDHGHGFITSLEPVAADVSPGDWLETGAVVGEVASGAHCADRCIHWGVRLDGEYIDPALLIRDMRPSILLPLRG